MKPTRDQIERLPKWAQRHIENLERKVSDTERSLAQANDLRNHKSKTNVVANDHGIHMPERRVLLPPNSRVSYFLATEPYNISLDVKHDLDVPNAVEVYTGQGRLNVIPWSSNVIKVEVDHR